VAVDRVLARILDAARNQMRDDLVAVEIEVDPLWRGPPLAAA
jgi:hypothetical protein